MHGVRLATLTVLHQFEALRIIAPVFHAGVIPLFALSASEMYDRANIFFLRHCLPSPVQSGSEGQKRVPALHSSV